mgnify:CR=1 FL=1
MFKISVFGRNFEGIESVGGWQIVWRGTCLANAEVALMGLIKAYGEEDVDCNW